MKSMLVTSAAVMLGLYTTQASIYTDTVDTSPGEMDITQVEVTHDASSINFELTLDVAGIGNDAAKQFYVGFDTGVGGDTAANAWNSSSIMSSGMDYFAAAWSDGAGYIQMNTYSYDGAAWNWAEWTEPATATAGSTLSFSISRAALGVTGASDSFDFDVYTGWDSGSWTADGLGATVGGAASYDSTTNGYNTYVIPEPTSIMLLAVGSLGLLVARRNFIR